jgi:hypothetical protein
VTINAVRPARQVELRRARELQPFIDEAELLLDIHSMHEPCVADHGLRHGRQERVYAQRALGVPADLLIDTGHPGGLAHGRARRFRRPGVTEAGAADRMWPALGAWARDVAIDTLVRFLALTGLADGDWVAAQVRRPLPPVQRLVRVTEAVVAGSRDFHFLLPTSGLAVIPKAGTPLARDGERVWLTPYDHTVLVMPGTKNLKPGSTAVRLGRFEPLV